jgi:cytosine/uracil/thiamine/allantoin permease
VSALAGEASGAARRSKRQTGYEVPAREDPRTFDGRAIAMLWTIVVILVVLWLLGFVVFPIGGGLIHTLLVIALIIVIYNLVTGRRG